MAQTVGHFFIVYIYLLHLLDFIFQQFIFLVLLLTQVLLFLRIHLGLQVDLLTVLLIHLNIVLFKILHLHKLLLLLVRLRRFYLHNGLLKLLLVLIWQALKKPLLLFRSKAQQLLKSVPMLVQYTIYNLFLVLFVGQRLLLVLKQTGFVF
jgi:hypothetical protein